MRLCREIEDRAQEIAVFQDDVSLGVGSLMNARGLMELIILNIGLERGLITPTLFTIMVFMAIATTLMATPMFNWGYGRRTQGAS